jgi:hypothetical protein
MAHKHAHTQTPFPIVELFEETKERRERKREKKIC